MMHAFITWGLNYCLCFFCVLQMSNEFFFLTSGLLLGSSSPGNTKELFIELLFPFLSRFASIISAIFILIEDFKSKRSSMEYFDIPIILSISYMQSFLTSSLLGSIDSSISNWSNDGSSEQSGVTGEPKYGQNKNVSRWNEISMQRGREIIP